MIDLKINEVTMQQNAKHCKERNIKPPTFGQMQNPEFLMDGLQKLLRTQFLSMYQATVVWH